MGTKRRKRAACQVLIFLGSFSNFVLQLLVTVWPTWVRLVPKDTNKFTHQGAMLGLWRGCTRYLPGSYMCMDEFPEEEVLSTDEDSSENPYSLKTMRVLMLVSVVLSGLSNVTALAGYECITLSSNNYKFRRRCARFSGFLMFLSGVCSIVAMSYFSSGLFEKSFKPLQTQLTVQYSSLKNEDFNIVWTNILYIAWSSSTLGVLCGICLCCLAGSMYESLETTELLKTRAYGHELEASYRQLAAQKAAESELNSPQEGAKVGHIRTLQHQGRPRRIRNRQNGSVPPNLANSKMSNHVAKPVLRHQESVETLSSEGPLSFALPKPRDLHQPEDLTDCDIETSLAVGACSLLPKTVGSLERDSSTKRNQMTEEPNNYVMDGYV
ncbi:Oidioi.mRNA.OKI2018_I69.chr1.g1584.t1.cds [Oikopleura dioica]|uniref:Oidioi.mRNA.OKI2018_I69.chr1.g1584.t1.cds n=1 Tax=Oikopleura dioica TaxID=34765 RepID=A0ABN7SUP5_OIKDI|nr:Oidioi.mRNA.OKI2018_I69.chr1.g1584.t1.cds [Oikopleura dioica]